jgi:hypothetical protein
LTQTTSQVASIGVGAVNVLNTLVSVAVVDKVPRRLMLWSGFFACFLILGALGFVFEFLSATDALLGPLAITLTILFIVGL